MANLGSDDTPVVADTVRTRVAEIDDTDSPYLTDGENQLEVDTSGGDVTVTIASADIPASGDPGRAVTIVNTAAGSVTVETEGTEQIQPDGVGSLTIETSGAYLDCRLLAGAVYVERNVSRNQIDASTATLDTLNNADTSTAAENEVLRKGASGTDLFFGSIDSGVDFQFQEFTASTTWSKPTDATWFLVDVISAGGGGGGNDPGGGGGGGGRIIQRIPQEVVPSDVSITVGAGGSGGSSGNNGARGGSSSFGDLIVVAGGGGTSSGDGGSGGGGWNRDGDAISGTLVTGLSFAGALGSNDGGDNSGGAAEWGGGAGGANFADGGNSWRGAGGGGGGPGGDAGTTGVFGGNGGADGSTGSNGDDGGLFLCGDGGSGGDSSTPGGAGGFPGGGGGAGDNTAGGDGADGIVRVWYW